MHFFVIVDINIHKNRNKYIFLKFYINIVDNVGVKRIAILTLYIWPILDCLYRSKKAHIVFLVPLERARPPVEVLN